MNPRSPSLVLFLLFLSTLWQVLPAHAETKVITAEATYIMGDGESPSFAEAMVLQKAKQTALEQAGTYVESYTKIQNYDLTAEEIQTIAGGVLEVEVLEKSRTLVGDGLRFSIKIKTTVTNDRMEELAQRIKGRNVAGEYKKLQEEYAKLAQEIESWKQLVSKTKLGPEREAALEEIRERERAFSEAQKNEVLFFQRLVAGKALVARAQDERAIIEALVRKIVHEGHLIKIGEPTSHMTKDDPDKVKLRVPVTLQTSDAIRLVIKEAAQSLGGEAVDRRLVREFMDEEHKTQGTLIMMGRDAETARYFQKQVGALTFVLNIELDNGETSICEEWAENYDQRSPFYLETNPIVPVTGDYQRFTKHYGDKAKTVWGQFDNKIVRWVGDDRILFAGSRNPIDPILRQEIEKDSSGRVVVFDDVRSFTVTTIIPLAKTEQIKAIRGEFVENGAEHVPVLPERSAAGSAKGGEEGSWWQRFFGAKDKTEKTDPMAPPELKTRAISCSIEP